MNFTALINNPYIIFMSIGALCAVLELILIIIGKPNEEFQRIGTVTSWFGLLFIILDYLFGKYYSLAQAMKGLSDHLLIFGEINLALLLVSAAGLVFFLIFRSDSFSDTRKIRAIFLRSLLFSACSIILRWLLTGG